MSLVGRLFMFVGAGVLLLVGIIIIQVNLNSLSLIVGWLLVLLGVILLILFFVTPSTSLIVSSEGVTPAFAYRKKDRRIIAWKNIERISARIDTPLFIGRSYGVKVKVGVLEIRLSKEVRINRQNMKVLSIPAQNLGLPVKSVIHELKNYIVSLNLLHAPEIIVPVEDPVL
jgi:hypothetical protein